MEAAFFVGDETRDIEASQKAGIRVAAMTWGFASRSSLEAMQPDFMFENAGQLVDYLKSLQSQAQPVA